MEEIEEIGEKIYEMSSNVFLTLSNHYGFDFGYLDNDNVYKINETFLNYIQAKGLINDLETFCVNTFSGTTFEVLIDDSIRNFMASDTKEIDFNLPFNKFYTFQLSPDAVLDSNGDVIEVHYKKNKTDTQPAICEYRTYHRETWGQIPSDEYRMKRDIIIRYFKYDGTSVERSFMGQELNDHERKKIDKKARANVIELTRHHTGEFIKNFYINKMMAGQLAMEDLENTILMCAGEAFKMVESLNDEISAYRDDRKNAPLVNALNLYSRTTLLTDEIINYMRDYVNIEYYTRID